MTSIDDTETAPADRLPRRTVLRGAAWSLPVIAAAVATPVAAATDQGVTALTIASGSALTVSGPNQAGSPISGSFGASLTVTNSKLTPVSIDSINAEYTIEGPVGYADLLFEGAPITGGTLISDGYTWSVLVNTGGYVELALLAPLPVTVGANDSVTVSLPQLAFADALTDAAAWLPLGRRVRANLTVNAYTSAGSLNDVSGKSFPANQ